MTRILSLTVLVCLLAASNHALSEEQTPVAGEAVNVTGQQYDDGDYIPDHSYYSPKLKARLYMEFMYINVQGHRYEFGGHALSP